MTHNCPPLDCEVMDALMKRLFLAAREFSRASREANQCIQSDDEWSVKHRMQALDEWALSYNQLTDLYPVAIKASRALLEPARIKQRRHEAAVKANITRKAKAKAKAA